MQIHLAIRSLREACALKHTALTTEKSYAHWILKYAAFLKTPKALPLQTPAEKMEAFLTDLALQGVSVSTQNQAFSALLFFYRHAPKVQLGKIDSLRAQRPSGFAPVSSRRRCGTSLHQCQHVVGHPPAWMKSKWEI